METGRYYTVTEDDCVLSIAYQTGFTWQTLWQHSKNEELRNLRRDPNLLAKGDQIYIPERSQGMVECASDAKHSFVRKGTPAVFCFRFLDGGQPRNDVPYELTIEYNSFSGRTDDQGYVRANISPAAKRGRLILGTGDQAEVYELRLGRLDPCDTMDGAVMRLRSLGFHCENNKDSLQAALLGFQMQNDLELTGTLDNLTLQQLSKAYGC